MVYKLNILQEMLPILILRKDLTPKVRCELITTCYCVITAYVNMNNKYENLKRIAKAKGSPPGNISTLKERSGYPPRGAGELKRLWRSKLLEHMFETWRDWSRMFQNNNVVKHSTVLDTSSKLLTLIAIRTSSETLHVPIQYVGIVELLVRPLVKHLTSLDLEISETDSNDVEERQFFTEMESSWASSIAIGFDLCVRIFRQDYKTQQHHIDLCRSVILRSGLTDHALIVVKSKVPRRYINLITSATRVLELSLSQNVYIFEEDNITPDEKKTKKGEKKITFEARPPGMDDDEMVMEEEKTARRISNIGPTKPPGITPRTSLHTSTIAHSISKAAHNILNEGEMLENSKHLSVLTKSLKNAAHALDKYSTSNNEQTEENEVHRESLVSSLSHAAFVLNTSENDQHKNIAKALIQSANKLKDSGVTTVRELPLDIAKADDEMLLQQIRTKDEKSTHAVIAVEIHTIANQLEGSLPPGDLQTLSSSSEDQDNNNLSPPGDLIALDAADVEDIENRLKHATLKHAASGDNVLQVFDTKHVDFTGLPPGLRAPGIFQNIISSDNDDNGDGDDPPGLILSPEYDDDGVENLDEDIKNQSTHDTNDMGFITRLVEEENAEEDVVEQHVDELRSRPQSRSKDMSRSRVDSTQSDRPVEMSRAHFRSHEIDVSNLDKLKPLCGILNGVTFVILQEYKKEKNITIQSIVSKTSLRQGFLSTVEHISRYFEKDPERTILEIKQNVDTSALCELLSATKQEDIDLNNPQSVTFLTYLVRLVGLWTSDMALMTFVERDILHFCFYTIEKYPAERVMKMSKYLSDALERGEICALSKIDELCDNLRSRRRHVVVTPTEMSSLEILLAMVVHRRDIERVHASMTRVLQYVFRDGVSSSYHDSFLQFYINTLDIVKHIAMSGKIGAQLVISMSDFTHILGSLTHFEKRVDSKEKKQTRNVKLQCRRLIFEILVLNLNQASEYKTIRLDSTFLSRHIIILEKLMSDKKFPELSEEFSRPINKVLCRYLNCRGENEKEYVSSDILKLSKHLDLSNTSSLFQKNMNKLLNLEILMKKDDTKTIVERCTNTLESVLDLYANSYSFGGDYISILSCYKRTTPIVLTSLSTLEKNAENATLRTCKVVTRSVKIISEAIQVVRLISLVNLRNNSTSSIASMNATSKMLYASVRTHRILHLKSNSLSVGYKSFGGILWSSLSDDIEETQKNPIVSPSLMDTFKDEFKSAPMSALESLCWILRNMTDIDSDGAASARSVLIDAFVCVAAEWNRSKRGSKQEQNLIKMIRLLVNSFCMNSVSESMRPIRFVDQSALRTSLCYCRDLIDHFVDNNDITCFDFSAAHAKEPEIVDTLLLSSQLTISSETSLQLRRVLCLKIVSISMRTIVYHETAIQDVIRAAQTVLREEVKCVLKKTAKSGRKIGRRCMLMFLQSQSFRRSCCGMLFYVCVCVCM